VIFTAYGTLEGQGPNKGWKKDSNCRDLGFTSMTDNAATSANTTTPKSSNPAGIASPLVNMVNTSEDTSMVAVPEGTVESQGANG
jgi:hypothetical protein